MGVSPGGFAKVYACINASERIKLTKHRVTPFAVLRLRFFIGSQLSMGTFELQGQFYPDMTPGGGKYYLNFRWPQKNLVDKSADNI
jgi:hypothetical protein